jgi:uncharacterized RDD family membrane protein YckC
MIGNSGRPRLFVFILDNLLATVAAFLAVAALKTNSAYLAAGTLCLTYLGYFFLSEALWSRTRGKYLQGLVVVEPSGGRCGRRRALVRTLLRVVEANPLLFGGFPAGASILASKRNQRLGHLVARTLAVSARWWTRRPAPPLPNGRGRPLETISYN